MRGCYSATVRAVGYEERVLPRKATPVKFHTRAVGTRRLRRDSRGFDGGALIERTRGGRKTPWLEDSALSKTREAVLAYDQVIAELDAQNLGGAPDPARELDVFE